MQGRRIACARITPGSRAGTVTVGLEPAGDGCSSVTVAYALTALSPAGRRRLEEFAAGYDSFLQSWEQAIAAALALPTCRGPALSSVYVAGCAIPVSSRSRLRVVTVDL